MPLLSTAAPSSPAIAAKLDAIRADMRIEFEPYKNLQGVDVDGAIAHAVNDLLQIGDSAALAAGPAEAGAVAGADRQALAWLFAALLVLVVLQDGIGVRCVAVTVGMVGVWRWVGGG